MSSPPSIEPGGRVVTITHDSSDDLTSATMPDGSVRTFTYDSVGQMLTDSLGIAVHHLHLRLRRVPSRRPATDPGRR